MSKTKPLLGTLWEHFRTHHQVRVEKEMLVSVLVKPTTIKKPSRTVLKDDLRQFYRQII